MARQLVVEIIGDASKFGSTVDQATSKATTMSGKLAGIGKGVALGAGIAAFNLMGAAIGTAIGKLDEAHQAFLDDEVSATKLANALKNNIPNWDGNAAGAEAYATAQAKLGFTDDQVRDSIGQLVGVTHDLASAQDLNNLAMDIARAKGIDLATATDLVTKAHEGTGRGLKALGIDLGNAKTGADILAAAQDNVRGAAEAWSATNEGKLATSNVKVGEAMEKVGGIIDQVSQVVIPIFADALTGIIDVFSQVWTAIQPVVSTIASALIPIFQQAAAIGKQVMAAIITAVRAVAPVFKSVFGVIGSIIGVAEGVFRGLSTVVGAVFGVIGKVIGVFVGIAQSYFKALATAIGVLGTVFKGLGTLIGNIFGVIAGIVKGAINAVIGIVNGVIGAINAIQVHIDVGPVSLHWDGLNIAKIPKLHSGTDAVGGPAGSEQLRMLQAGERVTPADAPFSGGGVTIIVEQFLGSDTEMDRFGDRLARRLVMVR